MEKKRCKQCYHNRQRLSQEEVFNSIKSENYTILSEKYLNYNTPLKLICPCGHSIEMKWDTFRKGHRCKICAREANRIPKEKIYEIANKRNFHIIQILSRKGHSEIFCKCPSGHESYIRAWQFVNLGTGCKLCKLNKHNVRPTQKYHKEKRDLGITEWRKSVYNRDNYICQKCKSLSHGNLIAHHLNSYHWDKENRLNINNGITLCQNCHIIFHGIYGNRRNTIEQYNEWAGTQLELI